MSFEDISFVRFPISSSVLHLLQVRSRRRHRGPFSHNHSASGLYIDQLHGNPVRQPTCALEIHRTKEPAMAQKMSRPEWPAQAGIKATTHGPAYFFAYPPLLTRSAPPPASARYDPCIALYHKLRPACLPSTPVV